MSQDWHEGHFACFHCDLSLSGQRYVKHDEKPYCVKCFETRFAHICEECKLVIGTGAKDLSYKEMHWHESCFKCTDCRKSLVDTPFATKFNKPYCSECHDNRFAARCDGCGQVFRTGTKKFEYGGKNWHENCFCCSECKKPIATSSFIPRDNKVYCENCATQRFSQRCTKCKEVIVKGGITFKETAFHRECFTCAGCRKMLAGEQFTTTEGKQYCSECYSRLFAKKCSRCDKAITGLGKSKFVTYEDRHWHPDCFQCYHCRVSLVGQSFLFEGTSIVCPQCAKEAAKNE